MTRPTVALVTYTYNDTDFIHDLLEHIRSWTVLPDEIVIVDDGSKPAFALPRNVQELPRVRVLKNERNMGITHTKGTGLSCPDTDLLFSVDCDTRVTSDYLETCMQNLDREGVGLSAGAVVYDSGDDLMSRYLKYFGDNHNVTATGEVKFISGNAFLLRRDTWEAVGGFGDYAETTCEDHVLCSNIRQAGLKLWSDASVRAWQTRRISRHAHCMRIWEWTHRSFLRQASSILSVPPFIMETVVTPLSRRLEVSFQMNELLFSYVEFLYLNFVVVKTLEHLRETGRIEESLWAGFHDGLHTRMMKYPKLYALLRRDIGMTGTLLSSFKGKGADVSVWQPVFDLADTLERSGVLGWLESDGMASILEDEKTAEHAFSAYAESSARSA